ncbi:MAG TPA: hypothetical protein VM432_14150, partial [Bdellovibrionales bacterium]|nr:hypothetical protein [Bdellovibrionales bacterium]
MKNKSFLIAAIAFVIVAFGASAYFMKSKQQQVSDAPPAWINEVLVRPDSYVKGPADAKVTI